MDTHEYDNGEVTILWKPKLCIHAGICVKTLPQVYNPKAKPWVKPENATPDNECTERISQAISLSITCKLNVFGMRSNVYLRLIFSN